MERKNFVRQITAASGNRKAELVLKHASIVNVYTEEVEEGDIAIENGFIVGIGEYDGEEEVNLEGAVVCPGFIDGHIHLESSMVSPEEFQKAVLPHGTTTVITDPHEIANVAGTAGIDYMIQVTGRLAMDVFFMMPSCVPSTDLDESGAVLDADDLRPYYANERVLGLAELMDSYGTINGEADILKKVEDARKAGKKIDGHAPFLSGQGLNAYVTAGVSSDHECSTISEAKEKMRRGQWIMIREGTAAHNLEALLPLFEAPYYHRAMLVTDDKHPEDLLCLGHIDYIIKEAVKAGADPVKAVIMGSRNAAEYFGLNDRGAVAPGCRADLTIVSDLESFLVKWVFKDGKLVAKEGKCFPETILPEPEIDQIVKQKVFDSFHMPKLKEEDLYLPVTGKKAKVICLTPHELLTTEAIFPVAAHQGTAPGVNLERDIIKLAVVERHQNTGRIGLGYLSGYGLKKGAVASSIAHDSHNLIIAGINDSDMVLAGNCVRENNGGLAIAVDGKVIASLALPLAGLMSNLSLEDTKRQLEYLKEMLRSMGIAEDIDPFMTLAFVSLPVIPALRLTTYGLIDVNGRKVIRVFSDN